MATQKKGGGSRKIGRNKSWCKMYHDQNRRERNKVRRLRRTLKTQPNNKVVVQTFKRLGVTP